MTTIRRRGARRIVRAALGAGLATGLLGCGAAYYGTALGIFASQRDKKTIDLSFPDAFPTAPSTPGFATVTLTGAQITVERTATGGFSVDGEPTAAVTGDEVAALVFPSGYGYSRSNRDAGSSILAGDRLVVRIDGDVSRELTFEASDVASVGSSVADVIRQKIRALTPVEADVDPLAYSQLTASYDPVTKSYEFVSGVPGDRSAVVFQPAPRPGTADAGLDPAAEVTAARLGLGVANGGIERAGDEVIQFTVGNRGTDVIPAGSLVELFLSRDKLLDRRVDVPFGRVELDVAVAVGEARRFSWRNGSPLPAPLIASDLPAGKLFVLFAVAPVTNEQLLEDNLTPSLDPVQVYPPRTSEEALDFAPVRATSPIAAVTGNRYSGSVTISNFGAPVLAPTEIAVDLVLSADRVFDEPAAFRDPAGALAGLRINPTNPNRAVTIVVDDQGAGALTATRSADTITASYAQGNGTTVQDLISALNAVPGGLIDAVHDGVGAAAATELDDLLAVAGAEPRVAKDLLVTTRTVLFPAGPRQQQRSYVISGTLRQQAFDPLQLPLKLFPLYRLRPDVAEQETGNDVREASTYVRVYDRARSTFDATTGVFLPTVNPDDFAALEAVSQRPVNAGSIRQGQQRVFSFEIPDEPGLTIDESQLLVIVRSDTFDPHVDLLSSSGEFLAGSDDSALGTAPLLYQPLSANSGNRTFYLVVSPASFDEGDLSGTETFTLTISVSPRDLDDAGLTKAVAVRNVLTARKQRYAPGAPRVEGDVLIPFSLTNSRAEIMLTLPARARVRFRTRPVFSVGVEGVVTGFLADRVPSQVEFQPELDPAATTLVYKPSGGTVDAFHRLEAGVYTIAFEGINGQIDPQLLRLEVDTEFLPDE